MIADRDVERVLVVVAHPDDGEFWAGGTIAGWSDTGIEVTYCVLTGCTQQMGAAGASSG